MNALSPNTTCLDDCPFAPFAEKCSLYTQGTLFYKRRLRPPFDRCSGGVGPKRGNVLPAYTGSTFWRVKGGSWGPSGSIGPPGNLNFPKENDGFVCLRVRSLLGRSGAQNGKCAPCPHREHFLEGQRGVLGTHLAKGSSGYPPFS